jgi:hypothetical protein
MAEQSESMQFRVQWPSNAGSLPTLVNQITVTGSPAASGVSDGFYLNFGHVQPPLIAAGTAPEIVAELVAAPLAVTPVGSFFLSIERTKELVNVLKLALQSVEGADADSDAS